MHSAMAVWTSIIPTRLQVRNRDCIKSLPVSAAESTAQLPVGLWQHLPNEGDSGWGSTWCCFTWVSAVMQQNHMKMSSLLPETQFCQHYLQRLGANKEKNRNRARLEFIPLYTIIRLRKVCKIQGELSLENTFCLRDCCNVLAELSEKIWFSTNNSLLNVVSLHLFSLCLYTSFHRGGWSTIIYSSDTAKVLWGDATAFQHTMSLYNFARTFVQDLSPSFYSYLQGPREQEQLHPFSRCNGFNGAPQKICPHSDPSKLNMTILGNWVYRYDHVKDLEMRLSWITKMGSNSSDKCPSKKQKRKRHRWPCEKRGTT